ncbi:MAG: hypothetical protein COB22_03380 [Cycloclasticus sp.]|nr:MAG: hypothetical protein COB22_03380 [Cycloclasticus sp.]
MDELAYKIQGLSSDEFWLFFTGACVIAAACFYFSFRFFWRYRMMQDTPTALLRSASQGYNEFKGTAKLLPGEAIIAPLTKLECVWYEYKVEEKQSHYVRGRSRTSWSIYETGVSDGVFFLVGRTGKAIVDPDDAEVIHSRSDSWYGSTPYPSAGPKGFSSRSLPIGKRYRYSEKRIHENELLYVLGDLRSFKEAIVPTNSESLAAILRHWKSNPQQLLQKFDKNKDGLLDSEEWEQAVVIAKRSLAERQTENSDANIDNTIEKPTDSRKPFLISAKDELTLIRHFQYKSWAALLSFFVFGVAAVWMLGVKFQ